MKKLLYVDCLIRGSRSRTKRLADAFLSELGDSYEVEHLELSKTDIKPLLSEDLEKRDLLISQGKTDDPTFALARSFAEADDVLIAAPFWDLSFPSLLKVYFENISVSSLTFRYGEQGIEGLCKGRSLVFLTTRGGIYKNSPLEQGSRYVEAMSVFFGFERYVCVCAEGVDIIGMDTEKILAESCEKAKEEARKL